MAKFTSRLRSAWYSYINKLSCIDWADVIVRAAKTFVQVAVTYAFATLSGTDFSLSLGRDFWTGFWLSAGSAGVSAVWNTVLVPALNSDKADSHRSASDDGLNG